MFDKVFGDTEVTPAVQKGMALLGCFLTKAAKESSPKDDTPYVLTGPEKLGMLGDAVDEVPKLLGN